MTDFAGESSSGAGFHSVHAERDPESNWSVDLDRLLEEYLAKICAGEIPSEDEDRRIRVNFAEAALLLQGSVQVYSRKVEYLYTLVVHALEFISRQRQQDPAEGAPDQPEGPGSCPVAPDENDDLFWDLDEIPVEAKNCLDRLTDKGATANQFLKPPANLVVLEGDCLDTSGDAGELESYLLPTNNLFQDFILLDPCDAAAVNDFMKLDRVGKGQDGGERPSSVRKNFQSPRSYSGAGKHRSSIGKSHNVNLNQSPHGSFGVPANNFDMGPDPPDCNDFGNDEYPLDMDNGCSVPDLEGSDDDENDDPWKPLNPHEQGNLKVKPFKKVKCSRRPGMKTHRMLSIIEEFPLAKTDGTISPEFTDVWEKQKAARQSQQEPQPTSLYEKLRQSLVLGGRETCNTFGSLDDVDEDNGHDDTFPDFGEADMEMPENMHMDQGTQLHEKHDDGAGRFDADGACGLEDPLSNASLEDLCRSHLDALLASIAENEKQTELAARVSTWKQNIEHNLEEQDSRPPFDIHEYGEKIITKLSIEADQGDSMSFADVVHGREKHEVARTFSALLQLVNNGDIDLDKGKGGNSICHTAVNPFYVRPGRNMRQGRVQVQSSKKRITSPIRRVNRKEKISSLSRDESPQSNSHSKSRSRATSQSNGKVPLKNGKVGAIRCTPESKRRRKSRYVGQVDLHSAG